MLLQDFKNLRLFYQDNRRFIFSISISYAFPGIKNIIVANAIFFFVVLTIEFFDNANKYIVYVKYCKLLTCV